MKKIIIVRHAKSSWEYNVIDHERPLNDRGEKDAKLVSQYMKSHELDPDLILSSDAFRAKATCNIFIKTLNLDKSKVYFNHNLYDFAGYNLLEVIKTCENSVENLMVFGHNHAITAFVNTYGDVYIENVATSGVVIVEFDIDAWKDLKSGKTVLKVFPRDLKSRV
jgi:phosphohistidine phosphatase